LKVAQEMPIFEHVLPYVGARPMHDLTSAISFPAGIRISLRHDEAGRIHLPPIDDHRIVVHASAETWSRCVATGTRHLRHAGDIDLVPQGETGGYEAETDSAALEIRLNPAVVDRVAHDMGWAGGTSRLDMRHIMKNERIVHLARALDSEQQAGAPGGVFFAETIAVALATQLVGLRKAMPLIRGGLSAAQLRRLFDFIEARLDQPLTVAALAREAGASSSHLRHWFKQATGMTVHRYVVHRRIDRARRLLIQGTLSASEVALASGFAHQSHMARWMRRELGYTPRGMQA
jgi:AraC family transcriptional regulator